MVEPTASFDTGVTRPFSQLSNGVLARIAAGNFPIFDANNSALGEAGSRAFATLYAARLLAERGAA